MSNKGAIKKTSDSKDVSKTHTQIKTKARSSYDATSEVQKKSDSKDRKVSLLADLKATGDRQRRTSQNIPNRTAIGKTVSISKDKPSVSQSKPTRQTSLSSNTRLNVNGSPRYSPATTSKSLIAQSKSETMRKPRDSGSIERTKLREKPNAGYSEKRGLSTVYMPRTIKSTVTSKTARQPVESKSLASTRDKGRVKVSNAEKSSKPLPRQSSRERKKSRTLSPSEVKMLHSVMKTANVSQRAGSQRKDSGDKSSMKQSSNAPNDGEDDYDYEDDFEDYESDFQECTDSDVSQVSEETDSSSHQLEPIEMHRQEQRKTVDSAESRRTEEEQMLDSGHYELAEARKRAARIESLSTHQPKTPPLPELRQPVNRAYRQEKQPEAKSLPLSTDEGFEDDRSGDFTKSPPMSQISFIDFHRAKKDKVEKQEQPSKLSRRKELLEMIKLHTVEWSLIECTPIAYEDFIRNYGKLNTQQMSVQTNEDNLEVETQTDDVTCSNKWTQFPITCRKGLNNSDDIKMFKLEQIGVGGDKELEQTNQTSGPTFDILHLNEFLGKAGKVMLSLLEEKRFGGNVIQSDVHGLPFSEGFIKLAVDSVIFLCDRPVSIIHYSDTLSKVLLTIHPSNDEGIETSSKQDYITDCCIGCVWSTSEPSRPTKLFYSSRPITACCFHSTNYNVVIAGLQDGSISLWDLREDEMWHQKVTDKTNETDWILRSPTYTTANNTEDEVHNSEIVAIRVISNIERDSSQISNCDRLAPIQICTLDEEGGLIVWSVLHKMGMSVEDLGLAQWGDVRLVKSQKISLGAKKDKLDKNFNGFVDMQVDSVDINNLYLATNSNNILHATCIGNKTNPPFYKGNEMEWSGGTGCLERCPFKQPYFLVGCDDGTVRLHSLKVERALLQLKDDECSAAIRTLQWSRSKPFTIYALDNDSKIHIWDLSNSDLFPIYTISTKKWGHITSMQLSPCKADHDMVNQYLALGTESGRVEIHKLKKGFHYSRRDDIEQELNTFLRYVAIL